MPTSSSAQSKIGIGVIGCGHWGPNHVRNFSAHRAAQVVTVSDLDQKRLQAVQEQFPSVEITHDTEALLADARIQAVVVSTPTATHYALTRKCLEAGKHVLCEKPLATTYAEAKELIAIAKSANRVLMAGHVFLFNPGIRKLGELVASGEVGRVHYLHATRTNLGPIRQDVDCVWDLAPHDIYIFNSLLGTRPEQVSARGMSYLQDGRADVAFITFTYPQGILANIHVSWLDPKKIRQLTVVGDRKMVTWDDMTPGNPITIYDKGVVREPFYKDFGEFQLVTKDGDVLIPKVPAIEPLRAQSDYFVSCVQSNRIGLCGPQEGADVVNALEAIEKSMAMNGAPIRIEP